MTTVPLLASVPLPLVRSHDGIRRYGQPVDTPGLVVDTLLSFHLQV